MCPMPAMTTDGSDNESAVIAPVYLKSVHMLGPDHACLLSFCMPAHQESDPGNQTAPKLSVCQDNGTHNSILMLAHSSS